MGAVGSSAQADLEDVYGIATESNDFDGSFSNDGDIAINATGSLSGSSSASLTFDQIYGIYVDNSLTGSFQIVAILPLSPMLMLVLVAVAI